MNVLTIGAATGALLATVTAAAAWMAPQPAFFEPSHRIVGIGVGRSEMSDDDITRRTALMIEAQTFGILREPSAAANAERILSPKMRKIFADAEKQSGLPAILISAIAYLESGGNANAQSPTGPKGVMQIASGTGRTMGLRMIYSTKYKVTSEKRKVKGKRGRMVTKTVKRKTPYTVLTRDERMEPALAIPAAAVYLSKLESRLGGLDWAIFAYHCGEGCVGSMRSLTEQARGVSKPYTVPKMFFSATPAANRDLYQAISREMERDYSPTYFFRIMRAQELLQLYRDDPAEFKRLAAEYRYEPNPSQRAPHRLAVWLRSKDLRYQYTEDIERDDQNLVSVPEDPDRFGFVLKPEDEQFRRASPSAIGLLMYISYETRRLFTAMRPRDKWVPLEVTSLVRPATLEKRLPERVSHASGHVFDIETRGLPLAEREALEFILDDLGWDGYVGFVEVASGRGELHIGCAPSSREFFTEIYTEAVDKLPSRGLKKELLNRGPGLF